MKEPSMPFPPLPHDVWSQIIEQCLLDCALGGGLALRLINAQFNKEILRQLFVVSIKDLRSVLRKRRVPRNLAILYLQGFFSKRNVPLKSQRESRRTIFKTVDYNPDEAGCGLQNTCFAYRPHEEGIGVTNSVQLPSPQDESPTPAKWWPSCCRALVGSSSSVRSRDCNQCDMMNATVSVFGSKIFGFGADTDKGYDGCLPRDVRYWRVLMECQRKNVPVVQHLLREISSDGSLEEGKVASVFCDCFLIATRMNYPAMITTLYQEATDLEQVPAKLGKRQGELNCLAEAVRLGHGEIFKILLMWKWVFDNTRNNWTYTAYLQLILDGHLCLSEGTDEQPVRENLMRTLLDWTDNWRNIAEMKGFLVRIGKTNAQWALQAVVDTLRSQHHFRHERGEEGLFDVDDPLKEIADSGNSEMLKLYFDNEHLLLPHTTADELTRMRYLVICAELGRPDDEVRVDVLKLIIEHSADLLLHKGLLQPMLIEKCDKKLETWAWLAKKVGLHSICESHNNQSLGSVMLGSAVSKLNVETVRFLVNNKVQLSTKVSTFQVYEDDEETMKRLLIVRELLGKAGQGAVKERMVIETTFLPIKIRSHRRTLSDMSIRVKSKTRAAAKAAYARPRNLKRGLSSASKSTSATTTRPSIPAAGESNGSSQLPQAMDGYGLQEQ